MGKRNPQDSTLRNVRAVKKRMHAAEQKLRVHEAALIKLARVLGKLTHTAETMMMRIELLSNVKKLREQGIETLMYGRKAKKVRKRR